METHQLGKSNLLVSALGLGCMGMSAYYGKPDEDEALATIHRALELGINLFDTADMYAAGRNEELLGRAIRGRRDQAIVATKFGNIWDSDGYFVRVDARPEYVRSACEASLRRLGTDYIDLYYLHRVDVNVPIEETVGAMTALVDDGKVRFIGLSEAGEKTIRRAEMIHPITALQTEYSLWSREPENGLLRLCRELEISFVAYSPLGRGFLAGTINRVDELSPDDSRLRTPRFQQTNLEKNRELISRLRHVAGRNDCTVAQLSLAWLLTRRGQIVPIPGTKRRGYLEENVAALAIQLTDLDLVEIDQIMRNGAAVGARYPEPMLRLVDG